MPKPPIAARLLVKVGEDNSGACRVERFEWFDATAEQAQAYANNDPKWRDAKPETAWASRLWRRVTGA